jgi:hypothetical protein
MDLVLRHVSRRRLLHIERTLEVPARKSPAESAGMEHNPPANISECNKASCHYSDVALGVTVDVSHGSVRYAPNPTGPRNRRLSGF